MRMRLRSVTGEAIDMRENIKFEEPTPRLNQCYLCKTWRLEKDLMPIEIPDQGASYIQKLACRGCFNKIIPKSTIQDKPQGDENEKEG